ncbi:MAG TPA: hypothetical protein VKU02_01905 [Gemmataceae bacterium]|nr:hypothetical protein [Gemmataceae bacterium]
MPTGTLTLALLALTTAAAPPDVVPMNSRNFQIPIHIAEGQRSKIKELILFASSDEGVTWNQVSAAPPDKDAFIFYAPSDGVYWFNICVVDSSGRREPPDIYKSAPRQKVLVDTLPPNLRIVAAERNGDEVMVTWEIQEERPDLATLKLEYRTSDTPSLLWTPVNITSSLSGQARFRVTTFGPLMVHMQMADQAGNIGESQLEVRARSAAASPYATNLTSVPPPGNTVAPPATPVPAPVTGMNSNWGTSPAPSYVTSTPAASYTRPAPSSGTAWDSASSAQSTSVRRNDAPGTPERTWGSNPPSTYPPARSSNPEPVNRYQPAVVNAGYSASPAAFTGGGRGSVEASAPVEITNSTQTTIDYEVTRTGPSGVSKVELYLTRDEGRSWEHYTEDVHPRPGSPLNVNLPGEGVFGLRLLVTSGAGLAKKPPQPGEPPQMRIEVDITPPIAKLNPPQPDPSRRDALILTWNASDRNLAANPITLQYAERPEGTWQNIAKELPNTGRYQWVLTQGVPYRVYLRMLVSDAAGNLGVDQTPEPVLIDLNEPEVNIKRLIKPQIRQ